MNNYLNAYADYFRYLSSQHPDVLHGEAVGERAFEVKPLEEAFSDIRTAATEKGVLVRLLLPSMAMLSDSGSNAMKTYEFGLLVAKYHGQREATKKTVLDAMSAAERIADDFIARLISDSRAGNSLFTYGIDNPGSLELNGEFITMEGDASYSGVLYTFKVPSWRCVSVTNTAWEDDGTTPTEIPTL